MNCTLFAIGCYIVMRAVQVLFEESAQCRWFKIIIKAVAVVTACVALSSLGVWYAELFLLGFDPSK